MRPDVALPFELFSHGKARDEIFIVYFDGFIKNVSEGILRLLLHDFNHSIKIYPGLEFFHQMSNDEVYDNSVLFQPYELLRILAGDDIPEDELKLRYRELRRQIKFDQLKFTTFEYLLYNLLKESFIKKCFFYKDTPFTDNEMSYLMKQYGHQFDKIGFSTGSIIDLYEDEKATSIFTSDEHIIDIFLDRYVDERIQDLLFVVLNNSHFIDYDEETDTFHYSEEFLDKINKINEKQVVGIAPTYNFQLNTDEMDQEAQS